MNAQVTHTPETQIRMLQNIAARRPLYAHLSGRSAFGGATATLQALHRKGFINADATELTEAGRAAVASATGEKL